MAIGIVLELRQDDWVFIPAADQSLGADCHSWEGYNSSEVASTVDNSLREELRVGSQELSCPETGETRGSVQRGFHSIDNTYCFWNLGSSNKYLQHYLWVL